MKTRASTSHATAEKTLTRQKPTVSKVSEKVAKSKKKPVVRKISVPVAQAKEGNIPCLRSEAAEEAAYVHRPDLSKVSGSVSAMLEHGQRVYEAAIRMFLLLPLESSTDTYSERWSRWQLQDPRRLVVLDSRTHRNTRPIPFARLHLRNEGARRRWWRRDIALTLLC